MIHNKFFPDFSEDPFPVSERKQIYCYRHKNQAISHICIEAKCQNNPLLCEICISENIKRSYHYEHESSIVPLNEGIKIISECIKSQIKPIQKIFKETLGRSENSSILSKIQKPQSGQKSGKNQLAERISSIKNKFDAQLELLKKQFEKVIQFEKEEFHRNLDNYQKAYIKNIQYIKTQTKALIDYQYTVRYFQNKNNLYLKIVKQSTKKTDWLSKLKKSIHSASKSIENTSYSFDVNGLLYLTNKLKIDMWPLWRGEENSQKSISLDLKYFMKRAINQWAYVPEQINLQEQNQNSISHQPSISKFNRRGLQTQVYHKNYYNHKNQ